MNARSAARLRRIVGPRSTRKADAEQEAIDVVRIENEVPHQGEDTHASTRKDGIPHQGGDNHTSTRKDSIPHRSDNKGYSDLWDDRITRRSIQNSTYILLYRI